MYLKCYLVESCMANLKGKLNLEEEIAKNRLEHEECRRRVQELKQDCEKTARQRTGDIEKYKSM